MKLNSKLIDEELEFGDTYRLVWQNAKGKNIGKIWNYTLDGKGRRPIHILLDDDLMKSINMRFLVQHWDDSGPQIIASSAFMAVPQKLREAGIWHEVGHIHHEHHFKSELRSQAELRAARISAVKAGMALPMETEADRFAVAQVGKYSVIDFLRFVLNSRPIGAINSLNDIGKQELEIRIVTVQAW